MALEYKVLEHFSEAARKEAASRVYDQPNPILGHGYVCQQGDCVLAVMLRADGYPIPDDVHTPEGETIAKLLGLPVPNEEDYYGGDIKAEFPYIDEIDEILTANDQGHLRDPQDVRQLLLGEKEAACPPASTPAVSPSNDAP